jgi:hypothetical protein
MRNERLHVDTIDMDASAGEHPDAVGPGLERQRITQRFR